MRHKKMILLFTQQTRMAQSWSNRLDQLGVNHRLVKPGEPGSLDALYDQRVTAAVVDPQISSLPRDGWYDLLVTLGRRIPIIIVGKAASKAIEESDTAARLIDTVTWLAQPTADELINHLDNCGAIGLDRRKVSRESIPIYNPQVALHMFRKNGALSILTVDASSFRKIAIEYGIEAYYRMQDCLRAVLFDLWGAKGSFRSTDILCRRAPQSNTYYILLEQSRRTHNIPAPGILEKLADRLAVGLQNALWNQMFLEAKDRLIPDCLSVIPDFAVGHATAIFNPCVDPVEIIESMLEHSRDVAKVHFNRMRDRRRELLQTIIQTTDLLMPNYQAVFNLQGLTKEEVDASKRDGTIKPLQSRLYGFESLIRVQQEAVREAVGNDTLVYLNSKFLRPDILFSLAHSAKVALELDQACLRQAAQNAMDLPGFLMVNILPRNLYHIESLRSQFEGRQRIIFEISESEAINNYELLLKVRANLTKLNMGIATDDFGKGFAGMERIITMKPDMIKLDRSLVQDIHKDKPKQAMVKGLVDAARMSKTKMLAEGVELWEEAEVLQAMGIELIQGFLLHRPQPVEKILADLGIEKTVEEPKALDTVA